MRTRGARRELNENVLEFFISVNNLDAMLIVAVGRRFADGGKVIVHDVVAWSLLGRSSVIGAEVEYRSQGRQEVVGVSMP